MGKKYDEPEGPSIEDMIELTEKQYELQGELVQDAMAFFKEQFAHQEAINQPIIDQQLETLIRQSDFAKEQQAIYTEQGIPAQQAAAMALMDLSNTPEGAQAIKDLTAAAAAVGGTAGEQAFRTALTNYGVSDQEADYLTSLTAYRDPAILTQRLEEGANYQTPEQVANAIKALEDFDSTARVREAEGIAAADVAVSGEAARAAAMQKLEAYGIDPSQIASGALDRTLRTQTNAQASLASSQARRDIQGQGLEADVAAANLASQSSLQELQTRIDSSTQLMQSRVRELQMQGLSAEEARLQADREIGYSQQLQQLEIAQRGEATTYSVGAGDAANTQQGKELAAQVDAYNVFAGNPATSATAFGTASTAGLGAAGIADQATRTGMGAYSTISGLYTDASKTLQGGYGVANDIYGNRILSEQARAQSAAGPGQLLGSMVGTLGGAAIASDERLKTDIKRVGATDDGVPIYSYRYKEGGPTHIGVIAQELEKTQPGAVSTGRDGMKAVDYKQLDEGGPVPVEWSPSGGAMPDDVRASMTAREFVIPEDAARWLGEEKLGKMIMKAREDSQVRKQDGLYPKPAQQPPSGAIPS